MEIVTLSFPIYQILKNKRTARETHRALADFDQKRLGSLDSTPHAYDSIKTRSTNEKRRKMYSMDALDSCLDGSHSSLQIYASCMELNGENIIFLTRVLDFKTQCQKLFHSTCSSTAEFRKARSTMFRVGLAIYVSLVHARTANYHINIEAHIYKRLEAIFGPATALVAAQGSSGRTASITSANSNYSHPTPWDEPSSPEADENLPAYPMQAMGSPIGSNSRPGTAKQYPSESHEHIVALGMHDSGSDSNGSVTVAEGEAGEKDPLEGVAVPMDFDEGVFDLAFTSVRYMVWTETWQRYMVWKDKGGVHEAAA